MFLSLCHFFIPEIEMDFVVPLKDISVPEKKQAKFECSITKDVSKVMWYRDGDVITTDQKYDIIDDGKKHMLIINCCEFDDEDEYTVAVLGKTSAARLTVTGKCRAAGTGSSLFWLHRAALQTNSYGRASLKPF